MKATAFLIPTLFAAVLMAGCANTPKQPAAQEDYVIAAYGCFVWAEHGIDSFSKPWVNDLDLRRDFPEREPLAGWYDDTQERFDCHLQSMAQSGLNVLVIDWYPDHVTEHYDDQLNNATGFFIASQLQARPRFCLSLINSEPFAMRTDEQWEVAFGQWLQAFRHPSYWRVDGKPVFTIHSNWHLEQHEAGVDATGRRVAWLREKVREAGYPGILIGGGSPAPGDPSWFANVMDREGYDFLTAYNLPNWQPHKDHLAKDKDTALPYRSLMDAHFTAWEAFPRATRMPFVPYVTAQWDPRPWWGASPAHSLRYEAPTDTEIREFFTRAKRLLDTSPYYRLPTVDGHGIKTVVICAWNELAEGSILAPTRGEGDRWMRIVREVFDNKP